jgi:hypothetical protein
VIPCGHDTCSECLAKISANEDLARVADGNEAGGGTAKCPTCRGKIELNKVIDYRTFKKVHKPDEAVDNADAKTACRNSDDSETDEDDSEDETEDESADDADERGNLRLVLFVTIAILGKSDYVRNFIVPDCLSETEDEEVADSERDDEAELPPKKKSKSKKKDAEHRRKVKNGKKKDQKQHVSLAMLKAEANKSAASRKRYMKHLKKNWQPSAKLDKCVELLTQFHNEGEKTIIFSQFVSLLDLLQVTVDQNGWKCERYDGSMSADKRHEAIIRFTDKPDVNIMLISLKAGNAGLNLVAASRVIILDPFWNPFIEMQAVDRAHRIGQLKPVQVHRILIQGTVEDRIIELQERKKRLVNAALDEGAMKSLGRLDVQQLAFLFNANAANEN